MAKPLGLSMGTEDPNLGELTAPQQSTSYKFRVSSVVGFEPRTMCHLLGYHRIKSFDGQFRKFEHISWQSI